MKYSKACILFNSSPSAAAVSSSSPSPSSSSSTTFIHHDFLLRLSLSLSAHIAMHASAMHGVSNFRLVFWFCCLFCFGSEFYYSVCVVVSAFYCCSTMWWCQIVEVLSSTVLFCSEFYVRVLENKWLSSARCSIKLRLAFPPFKQTHIYFCRHSDEFLILNFVMLVQISNL